LNAACYPEKTYDPVITIHLIHTREENMTWMDDSYDVWETRIIRKLKMDIMQERKKKAKF
jgi:hypothetical protein